MARIHTGLNPFQPVTIARSSEGDLIIVNGLQRPQRWDGHTTNTEDAGITAPATAPTVAGSGSGTLYGDYRVYVRYLDDEGIPSSFSTAYATLSIASGAAVTTINYTNVPVSTEARVTQREIWRNTDGQYLTYYLDATIADNTTTTASSTNDDDTLAANDALRYLTEEGWPNADRFGVPPSWASIVVNFRNRMWYLGAMAYTEGSVTLVNGTTVTIDGIGGVDGGDLVGDFELWILPIFGNKAGTVSSVSSRYVTLSAAPGDGFGTDNQFYALHPGKQYENAVVFSEENEPESVPVDDDGTLVNMIVMQEDGDQITGGMARGSYLYIFKRHNIYRLSTNGDPRNDVQISHVAGRGCVNQRCWTIVDGLAFVVDREGAYLFNGSDPEDISQPIADYWREKIVWKNAKWFRVRHVPEWHAVRFFCCLDGNDFPRHALEFNYRNAQWYEIEYPHPVGDSTIVEIAGKRRLIAGAEDQVVLLDEGVLDGPARAITHQQTRLDTWGDGTLTGTVTSATRYSISDSAATFTFPTEFDYSGVVGAPCIVVASDGTQQKRTIYKVSGTTLYFSMPFKIAVAAGDTYYIGAIDFLAKFGTWRHAPLDEDNRRDATIWFKPLSEAGTLNVRRYFDHAASAETHSATVDWEDGYAVVNGSVNGQVDLTHASGHVTARDVGHVPDLMDADRAVEVELEGVAGQQRVEIYQIDLDGVTA